MKKKRWLSILLSLSLLLTLLPTQAFAEEGPEGTESTCTQTADCPAQVHEPDCPLWQEDSTSPGETVPDETNPDETGPEETVPDETGPGETGPGETGPDETGTDETGPVETNPGETNPEKTGTDEPEETQPTALEQLLALAETLPEPAEVTADNADEVTALLAAFTRLYADLTADEQESDEAYAALARVLALQSALDALTGEDSGPALLAETTTGVEYVDADYNEATGKVDYTPKTTADDVTVTVVDSTTTIWGTSGSTTTWYVVNDPNGVTISGRIGVYGDVRLILADGCTLTASKGISVPQNKSLTIYGQQSGTGKLIAQGGSESPGAGIGAPAEGSSSSNGPITINGGVVEATGGYYGGAGIGGGAGDSGCNITINGGTVTATGGYYGGAAGIGGGRQGSGSNITVNGGTVTATGSQGGAGIGGGQGVKSGDNTITGGSGSNITIKGGTVTATGGDAAAGIGGGQNGSGSSITISGGMVTATCSRLEGAAIGDGRGEDSSNHQGTEIDESYFTNAVVLRKSGASGSTLTGQVYGSPTLTTDAAVPSAATLTVPEGSTLTIDEGVTLTNNGTINNNGAIINKGTFTNNGTVTGNAVNNGVAYEAYEDGQFVTKKVYVYTVVTDSMTAWGTANTETWYVVNAAEAENLTIGGRITVSGDVHLILADGAKLTASAGIGVNTASNSLTIYGQTGGTGELTTGTPDDNYAGIGGDNSKSSGAITINGGTVKATGGYYGAGIGSGYGGGSAIIAIHGGTVNATGGYYGAGIGRGYGGSMTITITISGGTVTAKGGDNSVGIGGYKGTVTIINGGTVNATGGEYGAGIGGGVQGTATVTINGGTVNATGGEYGAGIGGSANAKVTVTINGGFVAATGGQHSAAIGSGGVASSNTGTEATFTTDDTNAVVLRKSAATGQVMTGQVYGEPTLTTDAEVPEGATLTIPESTSLTVGKGTTLTNSGAICMEGGSLLYGDPNYGTLTNDGDGKLYYLLTVEGGTATATEGMATYNGKTYAEEKATVTLTAEDQVGLALKDWTASPASASVTFTKVDENDETNQNYQFTMPAQVLTVTAGYENAPTYTVTIPASVSIGNTATAAIEATGVNVAEGYNLNVTLTATSGENDAFTLALSGHPDVTLGYTMTLTKTTVKLGEDGTENTTEPNSAVTVSENPTVLTIPGGTADSSGSSTLTFAMTFGQLKQYSGTYTGTVTFSVSVTEDKVPDDSGNTGGDSGNPGDSDNPGDNPGGSDNPGDSGNPGGNTGGDSDNTSSDTGTVTFTVSVDEASEDSDNTGGEAETTP